MPRMSFVLQALTAALFTILGVSVAIAADQEMAKPAAQAGAESGEQIYGSELMTKEERAEHRAKMRSLKTAAEREAYRKEHHMKMQERAKKMGKTLPDMPPAAGSQGGMMAPKPAAPAGGGY